MKYYWGVYNKQGALITRTLTKRKALEIAKRFPGASVTKLVP